MNVQHRLRLPQVHFCLVCILICTTIVKGGEKLDLVHIRAENPEGIGSVNSIQTLNDKDVLLSTSRGIYCLQDNDTILKCCTNNLSKAHFSVQVNANDWYTLCHSTKTYDNDLRHPMAREIYHSTNQGQSWRKIELPESEVSQLLLTKDNTLLIGGNGWSENFILRVRGDSCVQRIDLDKLESQKSGGISRFYQSSDGTIHAIQGSKLLLTSKDDGQTWKCKPVTEKKLIDLYDDETGLYITQPDSNPYPKRGYRLLRTTDFGETWKTIAKLPWNFKISTILPCSGGKYIAVGSSYIPHPDDKDRPRVKIDSMKSNRQKKESEDDKHTKPTVKLKYYNFTGVCILNENDFSIDTTSLKSLSMPNWALVGRDYKGRLYLSNRWSIYRTVQTFR